MAIDSIIARPTNSVRVMVAEASGCWASALSAVATDRPSLSAGATQPTPIVSPAETIEATAMMVMLSIELSSGWFVIASRGGGRLDPGRERGRGGRDIDR